MNNEEKQKHIDPLEQAAHNDGMTVPDGYFADFNARMAANLPPVEFEQTEPHVLPRSLWQKVRPYVYMAAMFAGIWCMMKMFTLMRNDANNISAGTAVLAEAVNNDIFFNDYIAPSIDEQSLMDDLYNEGFIADDFTD